MRVSLTPSRRRRERRVPPSSADKKPCAALRVLLAGKMVAESASGGGEIQMLATAESLRSLDVAARLHRPKQGDPAEVDCLHLFGSHPEHLRLVQAARRRGIPVVLSPIAWFDLASYWRERRQPAARLAASARFLARAAFPWLPSWRRRLYHSVDLLLPNSLAEARQLVRYFQIPPERIHVIPNGAHPRFARVRPEPFVQRFGLRDFVLCAGRIEPRKNQLDLIRALRRTKTPVVLLGETVPGHEAYLAACRRAAGPEVHFLGRLDHEDPLLGSAYAACGCLTLCSWFETPGLVALEAGMSGVPLVLPECGATREYFGQYAAYVQPGDLVGIRRAVEAALTRGRSRALARHVQDHFTWQTAAEATEIAYRHVC